MNNEFLIDFRTSDEIPMFVYILYCCFQYDVCGDYMYENNEYNVLLSFAGD